MDQHNASSCTLDETMEVIVGKWKLAVLFQLFHGTKRFSELQHAIPEVTKKVLTSQLRELEEHDIIRRVVYAEVPPRVEYSLTEYGRTLQPLLDSINRWGKSHHAHMRQKRTRREQAVSPGESEEITIQ
ncbi:winged helix-turn-helix transcriptional regulator [uncultured Paenibacillus sp.]|uniref:winged helix-turn-helix transcriptional regulator n=1 Tax=uncultured Paenibacillus sp. TaxID=227322 RepID=UPI0015A93AFF|nr:winged helix-turn-helix transcriptional regulator [uncultured Paenibacillus sp.]